MKSPHEMVTEFHEMTGQDIGTQFDPESDLLQLRKRLIEEEIQEFLEELDSPETDEHNVLKEMSDIIYVMHGMAVTYGWDLNEAVAEVIPNEYTNIRNKDKLFEAMDSNDPDDILNAMAEYIVALDEYSIALQFNLREAFRRVHENNVGRCIQPDGSIKRREDGKIIKNPDYPKVDLKDLL